MMAERYLDLDPETIASGFPTRHFAIKHSLCGHPLFELDRLMQLARSMPAHLVECNRGTVPFSLGPGVTPGNGISVEETVQRIAHCDSWVALKYVEWDPDYRALLHECVAEIRPFTERRCKGAHQLEGYIFLSSPNSVTPYHFDDEHNFLLQLRGEKTVHTWDGRDPRVLGSRDLERQYSGWPRNISFSPELEPLRQSHVLRPGDGLHIPVHSPHWVKNGGDVSLSFSVTFRTHALRREATVHWFNAKLRQHGFAPRPFENAPIRDTAKYLAARTARKLAKYLSRR